MRVAMIGRNQDFGNVSGTDPGVGQLVADQFFEFFAKRFGDPFVAVRVQVLGYNVTVKLFLVMLAAVSLPAQSLYVYSEFVTLDAKGKVVAPQEPREILSPAVARGAFATYQVVVDAPPAMHTWFYMGLNPEDAVKVTAYKPLANGDLQPIELPFEGYGPQVYWIDVWSDRNVPVRRIKVEPQLHVLNLPGDTADWLIYPMEFRVVDAQVPEKKPTDTSINC